MQGGARFFALGNRWLQWGHLRGGYVRVPAAGIERSEEGRGQAELAAGWGTSGEERLLGSHRTVVKQGEASVPGGQGMATSFQSLVKLDFLGSCLARKLAWAK